MSSSLPAPGIVAMRDSHDRIVFQPLQYPAQDNRRPRKKATKLVFNTHSKTAQLIQIWAAKGEPGMDVLGEETAARPAQSTVPVNALQPGFEFLTGRPSAPGFKH